MAMQDCDAADPQLLALESSLIEVLQLVKTQLPSDPWELRKRVKGLLDGGLDKKEGREFVNDLYFLINCR